MEHFSEKGFVFLKSIYQPDILQVILKEWMDFYIEHNIQGHLNKREDSKTEYFYVNNTFSLLNSFQKQQFYYLPVIDNCGTHDRITDIGKINVFNVQKILPSIHKIDLSLQLSIIKKLTDKEWKLNNINLQIYNNVQNPKQYHFEQSLDMIKYTIYLSSLRENYNGPLSYIEKTHKDKKFTNQQIKILHGEMGDVIITNQKGFHRRIPQKNSISYFLQFHFLPK